MLIIELLYFPLKIKFNNSSSNNINFLNKHRWKNSIISCGLCYLILNTYKFKNIKHFLKYLIIVGLMEKTRYTLFKLLKKIINKYTLNKVSKILEYIIELGKIFFFILFYFKKIVRN